MPEMSLAWLFRTLFWPWNDSSLDQPIWKQKYVLGKPQLWFFEVRGLSKRVISCNTSLKICLFTNSHPKLSGNPLWNASTSSWTFKSSPSESLKGGYANAVFQWKHCKFTVFWWFPYFLVFPFQFVYWRFKFEPLFAKVSVQERSKQIWGADFSIKSSDFVRDILQKSDFPTTRIYSLVKCASRMVSGRLKTSN